LQAKKIIMAQGKKRRWHCLSGQEPTELDKQVMYWENKGKLVPTRDLIKTPEQIEGIRRAGVVNTGVLDEVAKNIRAGMSTLEIDQICRRYCEEHNAIPACLNYGGDEDTPPFPMSVCTSINEVVCHGVPKEEDVLEEGDIINVDFTTILDGYYADASRMFIIGKTTPEKEQLVRVAKECLEIGMEAAKPFGFVGDIGHAIEKHCKKYGYGIVRDLAGHGVGNAFHEDPEVDHYGHRGTGMLLVPGMVFTIEPMINMGTWRVFIDADDPYGWEVITEDEKPSAQWEHTLLMTEHGVEILTY
jgi:methionyl aminopeptidase